MREYRRYWNGIKDLARGYGITDLLAGIGLAAGIYLTTLLTYCFM